MTLRPILETPLYSKYRRIFFAAITSRRAAGEEQAAVGTGPVEPAGFPCKPRGLQRPGWLRTAFRIGVSRFGAIYKFDPEHSDSRTIVGH